MSAAIVEMRNSDSQVAGLVHPNPISWNFVFRRFSELLNVPLVPYSEWLQKLEEQLNVPESNLHALRLLNMYRNIKLDWGFETEATLANVMNGNATKGSKSLRNAAKLTINDVDKWMNYWEPSEKKVVQAPARRSIYVAPTADELYEHGSPEPAIFALLVLLFISLLLRSA